MTVEVQDIKRFGSYSVLLVELEISTEIRTEYFYSATTSEII